MASRILRCGRYLASNDNGIVPKILKRGSSVARVAEEKYESGQKLHGYTVEKIVPVPELYLTAVLLSHDNTKAQHLHIAREDSNNVFGVAFRTTPRDSTGVPHILEHTALCGSEKYPVRDPFFKMLTRSLNTFMNAFTASDWTMYPFSSQNQQDYRNLMSIYLDAAFFPRLRELDFMQEGWRLEHEDPKDTTTPITFKGVVYNEMKGVFSNSQSLYVQKNQNLLLPNHTYSVISGGDPPDILKLSWQQLRDFHASHYHPSNARFYTYGSLPLEDHLEFISDNALNQFSKITTDTEVPCQPRWTQPVEAEMSCMPDPMTPDPNKQTTASVSYLLSDIRDTYETFVLNLISYLLVEGETAPFYQSLIEPNIGSEYSPDTGYSAHNRDVSFSVGLQGIQTQDVDKVKANIADTFDSIMSTGFDQVRIDAVLHKIELGLKHQTEKFGLNLGVSLLPSWIHDGDLSKSLKVNDLVKSFKKNMAENPRYLQEKVKQHFIDNKHKLILVMKPDEKFETKRQQQEDEQLNHMVAALSDQDKKLIYEKGLELLEQQMNIEDLSCLPTVHVSDIDAIAKQVPIQTTKVGSTQLQLCSQPTNGVTYFQAVSDLSSLPPHLISYVPLFCTVATSMGAGDYNYKQLSQEIDLKTAGMSAKPHVRSDHSVDNSVEQGILFSSYSLNENVDAMFNLWKNIFQRLDMSDTSRLKTLIMMLASELSSSITGSGHRYAMSHAASALSPSAALQEQMHGISQISVMKNLAEGTDRDSDQINVILQALQEIAQHVLQSANLRCALNTTPEFMSSAQKSTENFINVVAEKGNISDSGYFYKSIINFDANSCKTHFELPFQVNYAAKCSRTVPYTHTDFPSLRILAKLMGSKYLHREIREKGGAYGGGAVGNTAGQFTFFSYRDPNSERTLEAFDGAIQWACDGNFTQQDINESKLAVFSEVDSPIPPGSQGLREFLYNINYDMYQEQRERLFAVTKDDLVRVCTQYLTDNSESSTTLLGPENELSKHSKNWNVIKQL